jgi:rRNA maturation protein Nop10
MIALLLQLRKFRKSDTLATLAYQLKPRIPVCGAGSKIQKPERITH